jgi:hypothetical protein
VSPVAVLVAVADRSMPGGIFSPVNVNVGVSPVLAMLTVVDFRKTFPSRTVSA